MPPWPPSPPSPPLAARTSLRSRGCRPQNADRPLPPSSPSPPSVPDRLRLTGLPSNTRVRL
ncbi:MAG: hypothetical protein EA367_15625 [Leptolyngbya sp. DLM2.Bin15]|nr:MAG: hypothetical protein EA367_15625 [Leptolyngbya sp. DLM2.Bin15]